MSTSTSAYSNMSTDASITTFTNKSSEATIESTRSSKNEGDSFNNNIPCKNFKDEDDPEEACKEKDMEKIPQLSKKEKRYE